MELKLERSSICSVAALILLFFPSQEPVPQTPHEEPQATTQESTEKPAPLPPPAPPAPPAGILPVAEIARIPYAPRDRAQVLLHGNRLVVVTGSGAVFGHDAVSGEFRWKLGLPGETLYAPVVLRSSPLEILLSSAAGRLFVVNAETGDIRRETELPFPLALAPLPSIGGHIYAATPGGEVIGYDLENGKERFRTKTPEAALALAWSGKLLVASGSERTLTGIDGGSGLVVWTFRGRSPVHAPAAFGADFNRLYVGNDSGEFYCLDAEDGDTAFRWPTGASIRHAALVEDRRVYVVSYGNNLYSYQAGGGAELFRVGIPGRPASGPVRFGQRFVVATYDGALVEIDPELGKVAGDFTASSELASPPAFLVAAQTAEPVVVSDGVPQGPAWYELHRIALALRTGEVLLLGHKPKEPEPPKEPPPEKPPRQDSLSRN